MLFLAPLVGIVGDAVPARDEYHGRWTSLACEDTVMPSTTRHPPYFPLLFPNHTLCSALHTINSNRIEFDSLAAEVLFYLHRDSRCSTCSRVFLYRRHIFLDRCQDGVNLCILVMPDIET